MLVCVTSIKVTSLIVAKISGSASAALESMRSITAPEEEVVALLAAASISLSLVEE